MDTQSLTSEQLSELREALANEEFQAFLQQPQGSEVTLDISNPQKLQYILPSPGK